MLKIFRLSFSAIIISFLAFSNLQAATSVAPSSFADLADRLVPAVVNISTTQKIISNNGTSKIFPDLPMDDFDELFERFGILPPGIERDERSDGRLPVSLGSGFITDPSGYIVTNHHVIADAEEITVKLSTDKKLKAKLIGYDIKTDLALLKVSVDYPLPAVKFGNSDITRVGDWVLAIGNPFGLGGSVTAGIISARARDINPNPGGLVDNFLQTDAAINKGNSGGPMFNMDGEVIGINTAIFSPSGGNIGIGFATPSSLAQPVLDQLKETGKVQRGWLGVTIQPIDEEVAESLGLEDGKGVIVADVAKGSPAAKAGLITGDIIISFDGKEINISRKLPRIVAETAVGKKVEIAYLRKGSKKTSSAILGELKEKKDDNEAPSEDSDEQDQNVGKLELYGITLSKLTEDLREKYGLNKDVNGLIITKIQKKGNWAKRGLRRGDVITSANQEPLSSADELLKIVKKAQKEGRKSILLLTYRDGQSIFIPQPITEEKN